MPSLTDIEGVGPSLAAACVKNRYRSIAKIATAKPSALSTVPGISEKSARKIITSAKSILNKSLSAKSVTEKARKAVPPPKIVTQSASGKTKAVAKKQTTRKSGKGVDIKEEKNPKSDDKAKEKIKKLKKKIKKLKKEKKKIIAKVLKKQKEQKSRKSKKNK